MIIKQLTGVILVGVTGLVTLGMVACDGDNAISGNLLKMPTLSGTYDYEHPITPSGNGMPRLKSSMPSSNAKPWRWRRRSAGMTAPFSRWKPTI